MYFFSIFCYNNYQSFLGGPNENNTLIAFTYILFKSFIQNTHFFKWYDTVEVQSNTGFCSSHVTIYINPVITVVLIKVSLGVVRIPEIALLYLIFFARVVQK